MTYADELLNKDYIGNVVVLIYGQYFAIRQPDSGLVIASPFDQALLDLQIDPVSVDLKTVNTTIGSYTMSIVDKDHCMTELLSNNDQVTSQPVRIWIGRSKQAIDGVPFPFSQYFELPQTVIKLISHADNSYVFTCAENTDKMTKPVFNTQTTLGAAMLVGTTVITASGDISNFPTSGLLKIDQELISYAGVDLGLQHFTGCIRGIDFTVPAAHDLGVTVFNAYKAEDNPINIILKFIISGGGGGPYDVYPEGLGINASLIDVAALENLRDTIFNSQQFRLYFYGIVSGLSYLEQELFYPNNLRVAISAASKISLALLDQSVFGAPIPILDEDTIDDYPQWTMDDNVIANQVVFDWDWDEGTETYKQHSVFTDTLSVATFGLRQPITIQSKGIVSDLAGADLVNERQFRMLSRFSTVTPQIQVETQINTSLVNIGDKVNLQSSQIPTSFGSLNFSAALEVISRSIDQLNGKVTFQLAFTSYTGLRGCYISPSDKLVGVNSQSQIIVAAGRGIQYKAGWLMRMWDEVAGTYTADPANIIDTIVGDVITFGAPFATTLMVGVHRMKFPPYDESTDDQHRYGFICDNVTELFPDGSGSYRILF